MKLRAVERLILEGQLEIMLALSDCGMMHSSRVIKAVTEALAAKPKPARRRKTIRNTGAFSGDIGDQGYRPVKMPTRP